jgi:hypothetical protein
VSRKLGAGIRLGFGAGLVGAGLLALHRIGSYFPPAALTGSDFELALAAALRLVGLAAGYWLAMSTALYLGALALDLPAASVGWLTLPGIRRLAEGVSARALVAMLAAPLPLADPVDPLYVPVPAGDPPPTVATTAPPLTTTSTGPAPSPSASPRPPSPPAPNLMPPFLEPAAASPAAAPSIEVEVQPGDNMWRLAESHLALTLGRPPSSSEVAPYWRRVVEANRGLIRSGNPDLIFPGEVLVLPAP